MTETLNPFCEAEFVGQQTWGYEYISYLKELKKKILRTFQIPSVAVNESCFFFKTPIVSKGTPKLLQLNSVAARDDGNISLKGVSH